MSKFLYLNNITKEIKMCAFARGPHGRAGGFSRAVILNDTTKMFYHIISWHFGIASKLKETFRLFFSSTMRIDQ